MGEEDVGAGEGEGEGEARGEEGLWVAAQEWRGMRSGDEAERWMHGTRQERDAVARDFGCRSAPTRRRRVTAGEVNLGGGRDGRSRKTRPRTSSVQVQSFGWLIS